MLGQRTYFLLRAINNQEQLAITISLGPIRSLKITSGKVSWFEDRHLKIIIISMI
jgi:hypothetical protein